VVSFTRIFFFARSLPGHYSNRVKNKLTPQKYELIPKATFIMVFRDGVVFVEGLINFDEI